jgi:hypothetical protein
MADASDTQGLEPYPQALYDAVMSGVYEWILGRMQLLVRTSEAHEMLQNTAGEVLQNAAQEVSDLVCSELLRLLSTDVDAQRMNPLHVLRACTAPATAALKSLGVPEAVRDQFEESAMPDDVYALGPLTWRDLGEEVHDAGINWGAYKAAVVISRRRDEGKIS